MKIMHSPSDAVNTPPNRVAPRSGDTRQQRMRRTAAATTVEARRRRRDEDDDDASMAKRLDVKPVVARRAARAVEGGAAAETKSQLSTVGSSGTLYTSVHIYM